MRRPLRSLLLLIALVGAPALTSSGVEAAIVDRVAAVVNDDVITLSEVYELGEAFIDEVKGLGAVRFNMLRGAVSVVSGSRNMFTKVGNLFFNWLGNKFFNLLRGDTRISSNDSDCV